VDPAPIRDLGSPIPVSYKPPMRTAA